MGVAYTTIYGIAYYGFAEQVLASPLIGLRDSVDLIFTSPPFPLNRKKKYGNLLGNEYVEWLTSFGPMFRDLLSPTGSVVIELGNAWEPGHPVMSTLSLEALLAFLRSSELVLCQQFVWHNPARLPSPAQWVNKERIRLKDSYTHLWWMARTDRPKANNRNVVQPYSPAMKRLLSTRSYNAGRRPSQHNIGEQSFFADNEGAIPSNVISIANTGVDHQYRDHCQRLGIPQHPARMPARLAEFFIRLLTDERDLVLDPFAGSNITGMVAERLERRWVAIEPEAAYLYGSAGRFPEATFEETFSQVMPCQYRGT